jgi:hypothetical protein
MLGGNPFLHSQNGNTSLYRIHIFCHSFVTNIILTFTIASQHVRGFRIFSSQKAATRKMIVTIL